MADEPAVPASRESDAHEAMEGQLNPPCKHLSESGVSIRDGTTERLCQPTTILPGGTDLGLEPAQTRTVTEAPSVSTRGHCWGIVNQDR